MLVSVIIPTYNRPNSLRACLDSLKKQCFRGDWEVLVVDDGGQFNLQDIIAESEGTLDVRLIRQGNAGPATARNRGVQEAKGTYIAFLDDDCEPEEDWLEKLLINAQPGVMIGGRTKNKLIQNNCSEASQILVSFLYEYFENTPWYFFTSNNFLVDKQSFISIGGFDENFRTSAGEDREFCLCWLHKGYKMNYCKGAVIWHSHYQSFGSFIKLHLKYGKAASGYIEKIKTMEIKPLKPSLKFYVSLFSFLWCINDKGFFRKIAMSGLLALSQLATFLGFLRARLII